MSDTSNRPLVIGMPVYNGEAYIRGAIESILRQTFTNFELFIADNCSIDGTRDICLYYAERDSRIRYFRHEYNAGALNNFQFVYDNSQSPYFMWAAADDLRDNNWIELVYAEVSTRERVAGFGGLRHIDEFGGEVSHPANDAVLSYSGCSLWRKLRFYLSPEPLGKANLFYSIFPRETLSSIKLTEFSYDYTILYAILDRIDFVQVSGPVLYKRIHGESEGDVGRVILQRPRWMAPFRFLNREFLVLCRYLLCSSFCFRIILVVAVPVKLALTLFFYIRIVVNKACRHMLR